MSQRRLVRLRDRYPTPSRMTLWRMRKQRGFPDGINILGTEYFYEDELEVYEESRRRQDDAQARSKRATEAAAE